MDRRVSLIGGLALGIGIGLMLIGLVRGEKVYGDDALRENTVSSVDLSIGAEAPDFELESLTGETLRLSDLRGQVVILNFWAIWCAPCRLEMPAFQERFERYGGDLRVVAVNFDEPRESVQAYADELGLSFDILLDPGAEIQALYRVRGYPTSYFLDTDGMIRAVYIGLVSEGQLDSYLADLGLDD